MPAVQQGEKVKIETALVIFAYFIIVDIIRFVSHKSLDYRLLSLKKSVVTNTLDSITC